MIATWNTLWRRDRRLRPGLGGLSRRPSRHGVAISTTGALESMWFSGSEEPVFEAINPKVQS